MRGPALAAALAMVAVFGVLTLTVIADHGLDPLTVLSLFILVMLGIGIAGALNDPGEDE